jgi:hypothetical protein
MRPSPKLDTSPGMGGMEIRRDEPNFGIATHGCMIAVIWGRVVELGDIEALTEIQHEIVDRYGCCLVLSVIRAGLKMTVDEEVRKASETNLRKFEQFTRGSAMVVEADGMRASFFRSIMTGITLVTRSSVPQKIFNNIGDAVLWLVDRPTVDGKMLDEINPLVTGAYAMADRFGERV